MQIGNEYRDLMEHDALEYQKMNKVWQPLPREEVIEAIECQNPSRVPLVLAKWWGEGLEEQYGEYLNEFNCYPDDVVQLFINPIDARTMNLSWEINWDVAHDAITILDDWNKLDEFIEKLPDPKTDPQIERLVKLAETFRSEGRYFTFSMWHFFFERPWSIRGMTNLLMDYHLAPDKVHKLHEALCDLYLGYLECGIRELRPDGFFTSDDLGHQTQLFMRPTTFRELIKPYYQRIGDFLKEKGLHWWPHSCSNNTSIMEDLIEVGVDVFHHVQKHTMDEAVTAQKFRDRMTFLAGIDVQHVLQEKDPDGVFAEVRFLIDTFDQPGGGMCIAAGNGIVAGTPFENIHAFLDEAVQYGSRHRKIVSPMKCNEQQK